MFLIINKMLERSKEKYFWNDNKSINEVWKIALLFTELTEQKVMVP